MSKKYGRTYHLPWSMGISDDDKVMKTVDILENSEIVITEKLDGENTTIHSQGTHARSMDSKFHASRGWMRAYAAQISPLLSENERIVGEYLFAQHAIHYDNLDSYFFGFAWIVDDIVQDWDHTLMRFNELDIQHVPIIYRGKYNINEIKKLNNIMDFTKQEGYVIRTMSQYAENQMQTHIGKFVRKNHIQTTTHWMFSKIIKNKLKE